MTAENLPSNDWSKEMESIGFEAAQSALVAEVKESGGLEGVFREFREDWDNAFEKYKLLLDSSTTPEQKEANTGAFIDDDGNDNLVEAVFTLADENGILLEDAPAFFMAAQIASKARQLEETN